MYDVPYLQRALATGCTSSWRWSNAFSPTRKSLPDKIDTSIPQKSRGISFQRKYFENANNLQLCLRYHECSITFAFDLSEPTWEGKTTQKLFNILNCLLWPIWPPQVLIGPVAEEDKGVLGVTPTQRPSAMTAEAGKCWYILHCIYIKLHQSRGLVLTERHSWKRLKAGGSCVNMWCGRWLQGLQWFKVSWDAASWDVDLCIERASECWMSRSLSLLAPCSLMMFDLDLTWDGLKMLKPCCLASNRTCDWWWKGEREPRVYKSNSQHVCFNHITYKMVALQTSTYCNFFAKVVTSH